MHSDDKSLLGQRLLAISGTLALIIFFVLGFAFGAWGIAWIVFLIPGMVRAWMAVEAPKEEHGYGINEPTVTQDDARPAGEPKPYPYD